MSDLIGKDLVSNMDLPQAVAVAGYVEQMLTSEHSWITNRLSWLFISQSFCITAYVVLATTSTVRPGAEQQIVILRYGLPLLGIFCSVAVGVAVKAAGEVASHLANERARITKFINAKASTAIPQIGVDLSLRQPDIQSTLWRGALPQWLPWVLGLLWFALLIRSI